MTSTLESPFLTSDTSPFVKNDGNKGLSTNILKHTLNVILGFIPRIHIKHFLPVILGFIPRIHAKNSPLLDTRVRLFVTPKNAHQWNFTKGLDVACQCAALLERLKTHIKINSLFCHPRAWLLARPEDLDSRVKPEDDHNNLRPQWAPDATGFLSDVYKRSARAQKTRTLETAKSGVDKVVSSCEKNPNTLPENLDSVRECAGIFKRRVQKEYTSAKISSRHQLNEFSLGRSMIEMLGVLAIIGVLSVGGIAGYSKAMEKFKINKTIEQMSMILANTRILYSSQENYSGLYGYGTYIEGIKPIIGETDEFLSPFGGYNWLESEGSHNSEMFHLTFSALPKEACMELATLNWGTEQSSGIVGLGIGINYVSHSAFWYYDNCINSSTSEHITANNTSEILYTACKTKLPIPPATAAEYCNICAEAGNCGITLFSK